MAVHGQAHCPRSAKKPNRADASGNGSDSNIDAVLSVEPFGWIRYTDNDTSWYDESLLSVFPTDRNADFLAGGLTKHSFVTT